MEKIILIVEDNVNAKLKYFLKSLEENGINYEVHGNLEDAFDFFNANKDRIDIVILDCGVPRKPNGDASYFGGLEIMPKFIHLNEDVSIILNTPTRLPYDALPQANVIYVSQSSTTLSDIMERKSRQDARLSDALKLLRQNNHKINDKPETYHVTSSHQRDKGDER